MSSLVPLFPLDVVLLPGVPLPLHVFEPRYKEMIAECLELKKAVRSAAGVVGRNGRDRVHRRDCGCDQAL